MSDCDHSLIRVDPSMPAWEVDFGMVCRTCGDRFRWNGERWEDVEPQRAGAHIAGEKGLPRSR